jgi:hypothetical protein
MSEKKNRFRKESTPTYDIPHGTTEVFQSVEEGKRDIYTGTQVGWFYSSQTKRSTTERNKTMKYPVYCAGPVRVGVGDQFLCVVGYNPYFCWLRNGKLWWHKRVVMPQYFDTPRRCADDAEIAEWADACARAVLDRITPNRTAKIYKESTRRYWSIVRALVDERILDAAALGYDKTHESFARSVYEEWRESDLISPRCPTTRHAVLTSLVLALEAEKAAQLIELASLLENKVPIISQEAALTIYQHSASILARLCPQWWNQGYLCDWKMVGSIERIFRAQHVRMLNDAFDRGVQFEASAGVLMDKVLSDVQLTGAEVDVFRDQTEDEVEAE